MAAILSDAMSNITPLDRFVVSMPVRYASTFSVLEIQQHARIVGERGTRPVCIGQFASLRHPGAAICIVAPDRPGLLATISVALALVGFSVFEAEIFTRRASPSLSEAVDFFWISRRAPLQNLEILPADVNRLSQSLIDLLGRSEVVLPDRASAIIQSSRETSTRVRFMQDSVGQFTTLEVDTNDRSGLLLTICQTLFAAEIQIIGSHIKTIDGRARGRFELVELDERPIGADRRQELQMAILSAIDDLPRPEVLSYVS